MTLAAHPAPHRPSTHGLAWRLPLAVATGCVLSYSAATIAFLSLWGFGLAEREGASTGFFVLGGVVLGALVLVVLVGVVLVWRALLRGAWWMALPSLALGPLALAAQAGLL